MSNKSKVEIRRYPVVEIGAAAEELNRGDV
jgi:hypothetical protein